MEYTAAIKEITSGQARSIYLICGEEPLLVDDIIQALRESLVPDSSMESLMLFKYDADLDEPERAIAEMRTGAFFGGRKLAIVKNVQIGKKEQSRWESALLQYTSDPNPDSVVAVVTPLEPPAKNPLKAACDRSGAVVRCARLKGREVAQWAKSYVEARGKRISGSAAWALEALSGPSLGVLREEIDKLVTYVGDKRSIEAPDIAAVCADASEIRVFAVTDAVTRGQADAAMTAIQRVLGSGEQPVLILHLISQNLRQIARAHHLRQAGLSPADAAKALGGHPFVASKAVKASARLRSDQIENIYDLLLVADETLKSGSDPLLTLQGLVAQIAPYFS